MLKVGELAERAGLTVRTLHHYDSIGLLRPSARSDAGYRLYDRDDVARLQQIQALRRFGMALADIGAYLDSPDASPLAVIERQLACLDRQIDEASRMRDQLLRVRSQLARGEAPELSTWLTTLEQMTMYDKYFSQAELQQLPLIQTKDAKMDWQALVSQVRGMMEQGIAPDSDQARRVARRWLEILDRDTGGNQDFARKLDQMLTNEPKARQETGISIEMRAYMIAAIGELRLEAYGIPAASRHRADAPPPCQPRRRMAAAVRPDPGANGCRSVGACAGIEGAGAQEGRAVPRHGRHRSGDRSVVPQGDRIRALAANGRRDDRRDGGLAAGGRRRGLIAAGLA